MGKPLRVGWAGVFPAVATPMGPGEEVDLRRLAGHLDRLVRAGCTGLVVLGTVGENGALDAGEKRDVLRVSVEAARGRVPVLAGVAESSTRLARRFAADAARLGADGLMVLPGMLYKADAREAAAHFRSVARETPLPILCYNNPVVYGVDLRPEDFARLADEPTLAAVKESSDDPRRLTDLSRLCGDRYVLFNGVDDLALEAAALGARGWVAGLVNAFPEESVRLWNLAIAGRLREARALYRWFMPLLHLDAHPKLVQYIKLAMAETGLGPETVRAPRLPLAGEERRRILEIVRRAMRTRKESRRAPRRAR
jgi:4-hydroxy-tetrahydrodipicolinate synthase